MLLVLGRLLVVMNQGQQDGTNLGTRCIVPMNDSKREVLLWYPLLQMWKLRLRIVNYLASSWLS